MVFGKLYTYEANPRSTAILAVAKANNLDIEIVPVDTEKPTAEYLKYNPLSKVPTFVGSDGYVLSECIAIAVYVTSQNEKTTLLGKTKQDYASILKWMSFFNSEILPKLGGWYRPLLGKEPYNKKSVEENQKAALKAIGAVESHLKNNTFLVGERITLADLFAAAIAARGFEFFFDKQWREENPNVTRWFETVYNQPIYSSVAPKYTFLDTPKLTNVPPKKAEKKEPAPKKEKEAPKPKAKPAADDEDEEPAAEQPKAKHPLALLPKATFDLDEWKRTYSNAKTPEAMVDAFKWFWEKVNFDEYSLWRADYKYNDELTMVFMSNNLIGGFNNRLEASRKYLFGAASVYGKNNDSVIQGAFIVRGNDYLPVFDVAPDYESYSFTKLDHTKAEDRAYIEAQWAYDKEPVVVNGKSYEYGDGKDFK